VIAAGEGATAALDINKRLFEEQQVMARSVRLQKIRKAAQTS